MLISIIIPAYNESVRIENVVSHALALGADEVLVVDGMSEDDTAMLAGRCGATVISSARGRAAQMNAGAAAAVGEVLLFLHADTKLPADGLRRVRDAAEDPEVVAGAFRLRIDSAAWSLRLIEWAVNLRSRWRGLPYGDQAIFVRRSVFDDAGGYAPIAAMEDFALMKVLRRRGRIAIVEAAATTSARRWLTRGIWRTTMLNQWCIWAYMLGVDPDRIARWRSGRPLTASGAHVCAPDLPARAVSAEPVLTGRSHQ